MEKKIELAGNMIARGVLCGFVSVIMVMMVAIVGSWGCDLCGTLIMTILGTVIFATRIGHPSDKEMDPGNGNLGPVLVSRGISFTLIWGACIVMTTKTFPFALVFLPAVSYSATLLVFWLKRERTRRMKQED